MSSFISELRKQISGSVLPQESMKLHTTWRIGGPAEVLVIPANRQDVVTALGIAGSWEKPITVIGNGSNLLVADRGVEGLVLKLAGGLNHWAIDGQQLMADSGCLLPGLVKHSVQAGLAGLEFAAGIPASLGGAVMMNAGAHGREIASLIEEVLVCDFSGKITRLSQAECGFAYRTSIFQKSSTVILGARFRLTPGDKSISEEIIGRNVARRRENQPLNYPNAGSVFRNPQGMPAGKLIEEAGGKGLRIGGALVSAKHANFIVNVGDACADDVLKLIQKVKELVMAKFQVELEPEIRLLGFSRE